MKVLLVEDSNVLTERLSEILSDIADVRLVGVANTEAKAIAIAKREVVDLVLLDLHLKEGTGFGVLRALAETSRPPRVIVLTNHDLPQYKTSALALGADAFLDKACDYTRLPEALGDVAASMSCTRRTATGF